MLKILMKLITDINFPDSLLYHFQDQWKISINWRLNMSVIEGWKNNLNSIKRDEFQSKISNYYKCSSIWVTIYISKIWMMAISRRIGKNTISLINIKCHHDLVSPCRLNSLWPSDAIWRWRSWSTLVQVMACCLTAPSHYLNQCWLIISKVLWHSSEDIIIRRLEDTNQ